MFLTRRVLVSACIRVCVFCWLQSIIHIKLIKSVGTLPAQNGVYESGAPSHLSLSHFLSDVSMINVGFYSILSLIVLSIVGVDIHVIIMGLGSIAVSLAFMIGPATSRAFEV